MNILETLIEIARHCAMACNGPDRFLLDQEAEDLAQDFFVRKFQAFVRNDSLRGCNESLMMPGLSYRLRLDFRSYVFEKLRRLRKVRPRSAFSEDFEFPEPFETPPGEDWPEDLSPELQSTLDLWRQGHTEKEIASRLDVSERTVRHRKKKIKQLCRRQ
jgi:DNA-directed RNA polymerase specialized sigma24 family protein